MASTPRNTRGAHKTQAVGVIRSFFRDSPLPDSNEFIEEFVMRHSYTYEYPDTPHGQRLWQQYHGDKINKEARQAILAKFGGKEEEVVEEDAEVTKEFVTQGEYADTDSDTSDGHFSLPLPVDEGVLADRDFRLPWNIYCPTGSVKPKSWKSIKRNIFIDVDPPKPSTLKSICACTSHCDESCLNKMLQFECDASNCPFGEADCGNREFGLLKNRTSRFYHQAIEIIHTENKGYGLRACRSFAPGELVCEYTGDVISPAEIKRRLDDEYADSDNYYFLNLEKGAVIDSGLRGSAARFVNHSCMPNCEMQKWFVKGLPRVGLFAGEDGVQNGQELTYDYNFVWFEGAKAQTCYCGATQCRGIIGRRAGEKTTPTERASSVGVGESTTVEKKRASTVDVVPKATPKKGRPKKLPVLVTPKTKSRDRDLLKERHSSDKAPRSLPVRLPSKLRESLTAESTPVKKRGRPKKVVAESADEKVVTEPVRHVVDSDDSDFVPTPSRRGRPPKVKRKRGRPVQIKVESHDELESREVQSPRRSRAHKNYAEVDEDEVVQDVEMEVEESRDEEEETRVVSRAHVGARAKSHDVAHAPSHDSSDSDTFQDAHETFQDPPRVREKYTATPDPESRGNTSSDQDYAPSGLSKPQKKRTKRSRRSTANYETVDLDESADESDEGIGGKRQFKFVDSSPAAVAKRKNKRRVTLNKDYRIPDYSDEDRDGETRDTETRDVEPLVAQPPRDMQEFESQPLIPNAPPGAFRSFTINQPEPLPRPAPSRVADNRQIKGIRQLHALSREGGQFSTGRFRVDRTAVEEPKKSPSPHVNQVQPNAPVTNMPFYGYYQQEQYPTTPQHQQQSPNPQPQYHTPGTVEDLLFPSSLYPENLPDRQKNGKTIPRNKRKAPVRYSDVKKEDKPSTSPGAVHPMVSPNPGYPQQQYPNPPPPNPFPASPYPPPPNPVYQLYGGYYWDPNYQPQGYGYPQQMYPSPGYPGPPGPNPGGPNTGPNPGPPIPGPGPGPHGPPGRIVMPPGPPLSPPPGHVHPMSPNPVGPPPGHLANPNPAPMPLPLPVSVPPLPPVHVNTGPAGPGPGPSPAQVAIPVPVSVAPVTGPKPEVVPVPSPGSSPLSSRLPPISSLVNPTSEQKSPSLAALPPPRLSIGRPGEGRRLSSTNLPLPTRQNRRFYGPV